MTAPYAAASPTIGVLVVNFFSAEKTAQLAQSLVPRGSAGTVHLSIVDNSVEQSEYQKLVEKLLPMEKHFLSLTITASTKNLGYGGGNNAAWSAIEEKPPVVLVVNPDVTVLEGSLLELAKFVASGNSVWSSPTVSDGVILSGLGSMSRFTSRTRQLKADEARPRIVYPGGHFLAAPAGVWESLGGFSPRFFLYCEEIDLMMRLGSVGAKSRVLSNFLVQHEGAATTSHDGALSPFATYHATRSRVTLFRAHPSLRLYLVPVLGARLAQAVRYALQRKLAHSKATLSGLADGLTGKRTDRTRG